MADKCQENAPPQRHWKNQGHFMVVCEWEEEPP